MRPAALILLAATAVAPAAQAHGPCDCLVPSSGPPGTRVQGDRAYGGYKVIFNPDRADLGIGPEPLWDLHHGPPPVTVLRRPWRYDHRYAAVTFNVPARTPPGRYLVAIYGGDEGGAHYTWETFTVTRRPAAGPADLARSEEDEVAWSVWIAAATGLVIGAIGGIGVARHLARPSSPPPY